MISRRY